LALTLLAIWFAWRAKTAAEQVRDQISCLDTIAELSAAITIIEEIMRLQRTQAWEIVWDIVLDRYATLQSHLSRSKGGAGLTEAHRASIQTAILRFRIYGRGRRESKNRSGEGAVEYRGSEPGRFGAGSCAGEH
jgi:hypothetical protein